jgi:hypothetical protein
MAQAHSAGKAQKAAHALQYQHGKRSLALAHKAVFMEQQ